MWLVISGVASAIAALSALAAVAYARSTVHEARLARSDAQAAHQEYLFEQEKDRESLAAAHRAEMKQRTVALASEVTLQRVSQVQQVATILMDLADTARAEESDPPPLIPPGQFRMTRIPSLLMQLGASVTLLEVLGGPELLVAGQLAAGGYSAGSQPITFMGTAIDALRELQTLAGNDERLRVGHDDGSGSI